MQALLQIVPILVALSLAGLVLAVGLNSSPGDLRYVLVRPKALVRAILAVLVIPPIAAGVLLPTLPLPTAVKAAVMLMAISPVPPLVPGKELAVGGRKAYAYGLYVAMALLTVVSVPAVLAIVARIFDRDVTIPWAAITRTVLIGVLIPLAIGCAIRRLAPTLAERSWRLVYRLSLALVLLAFAPVLVIAWPSVIEQIGNGAVAVIALVTLIALAGGHLLGGPALGDRATLAVASSVRHPGIAVMIAGASGMDRSVTAAVLLFLLVGLVVSLPYTVWVKRRGARGLPGPAAD